MTNLSSNGSNFLISHKVYTNNRETFLIGYSRNKCTAARIHFDIAHELGHILLHDWDQSIENIEKSASLSIAGKFVG
mgnify:CR=1 FL=1